MKKYFDIKKIIFTLLLLFTVGCIFAPTADAVKFFRSDFDEIYKDEDGNYMTKEKKSFIRQYFKGVDISVNAVAGFVKGGIQGVKEGEGFWGSYWNMIKGAYKGAWEGIKKGAKGTKVGEVCKMSTTRCLPYCKYESKEICLLCPVFAVVFNAVNTIAVISIETFSSSVIEVVVVAFGVWLAIQVLSFVSSIETRDLKDLMSAISTQAFIIILVVSLLSTGASNFFNTFIFPIYNTGQRMAQTMFSSCANRNEITSKTIVDTKCEPKDADVSKIITNSGWINKIEGGISPAMGYSIIQTMTMMENRVRKFQALGNSLMCQSWVDGWVFFPKISYFLTGFVVWVFATMIIIAVPFLMVDSVFQLGVAMALLPVAVGGFAFKSTRQYTKKVWETMLNSMFAFLFISVVVLILLGVLWSTITGNVEIMSSGGVDFDSLFDLDKSRSTANLYEKILANFRWWSADFLRIVFVFILAWSVMEMAKEMADTFASSISSTSIGSSIGGMAASGVKGVAGKFAAPYTNAAKAGVKQLKEGVTNKIRHSWSARIFKRKQEKARKKAENQNNKNEKIKVANGVITKVKKNGDERVTTYESKDLIVKEVTTIRTIKGKTVAVTKQEIISKDRRLNDIMELDFSNKDAKEKLDKYMEGKTAEEKKLIMTMLAEKQAEKRLGRSANKYKIDNRRVIDSETVNINVETGEMLVREVTTEGETIFRKTEFLADGQLKTSLTIISKNGEVTELSSDGIHNKLLKFKLQDGTQPSQIKNLEDIIANKDKNQPMYVNYGYTNYAQSLIDSGVDPDSLSFGMLQPGERGNSSHDTMFQRRVNGSDRGRYQEEMSRYFN